ncbi:MAG TPA: metallophosphoesterase, partial [Anseongella sp.]|nr:metallophosphoesterase [Anseongella sp.]
MLDRILLMIPVWLLLDLYFFQALKSVAGGYSPSVRRGIYLAYWLFDALLISALLYLKASGSGIFSSGYFFLLVGPILLSFVPKLLVLPFLVLEDLSR